MAIWLKFVTFLVLVLCAFVLENCDSHVTTGSDAATANHRRSRCVDSDVSWCQLHRGNCRENLYIRRQCRQTCSSCSGPRNNNAAATTTAASVRPGGGGGGGGGTSGNTHACASEPRWCRDRLDECGKGHEVDRKCSCFCLRAARKPGSSPPPPPPPPPPRPSARAKVDTTTLPPPRTKIDTTRPRTDGQSPSSTSVGRQEPTTVSTTSTTSQVPQRTTVGPSSTLKALTSDTTSFAYTTTPLPTERQTTATPAVSTRSCYQCGSDVSSCSAYELLIGQPQPCPPGLNYCATYVSQVGGVRNVVKRCVDTTTCHRDWYELSSDLTECMSFEPRDLSVELKCTYCCAGESCNKGVRPGADTLYSPHSP